MKAKIRNRFNQEPHLTQGTTRENAKAQENIAYKRANGEYMQLASGFMQLAAAGRISATKYIFTVFLKGKMLIVH